MPGVFELPGGHIEFGESFENGLKREILEEFGVNIDVEEPVFAVEYLSEQGDSQTFEVIFLARLIDAPDAISLSPVDHSEFQWITFDEVHIFASNRKSEDPELLALNVTLKSNKFSL